MPVFREAVKPRLVGGDRSHGATFFTLNVCFAQSEKTEPIVYSPLAYNKVQPPKEGCLVGFYKDPNYQSKGKISFYEKTLGAKPSIIVLFDVIYSDFPMIESRTVVKSGVVPYISIFPGWGNCEFGLDEIALGQRDSYIKSLAQGATKFGKRHGGFFFTTMVEPNINSWYWGQNSNYILAWRRIWQIFEDQGANQYATWVWEVFCPEIVPSKVITDPEQYYPGDKYIDWIGLNAFSNVQLGRYQDVMFDVTMHKTYERMLKDHPQKPIMQSEFGRTRKHSQPEWLISAYRSIKNDFPKIKAAIYYDNINPLYGGLNHTLEQKSLETLKEIFKDPYWIMAK